MGAIDFGIIVDATVIMVETSSAISPRRVPATRPPTGARRRAA